jgi:rubrerythrin
MNEIERIWSEKSDEELVEAAAELSSYTEEGQEAIRNELRRRGLEDPVEQAGGEAIDEDEVEEADAAATDDEELPPAPDCLRCHVELRYQGSRRFDEEPHWTMFGQTGGMFEGREAFDVYVCPRCGRVELFVVGIGGRPQPE